MALRMFHIGLVAIIAATFCSTASSQSDCRTAIISLSPCLDYVRGKDTSPSSSCCSQLASVVKEELQCLCPFFNGRASSLGITLNQTLALALPGACRVQSLPISRCSGNGGAPSASPSASPTILNTFISGSESKSTVQSEAYTNTGISSHIPFSLIFSFLFIAVYVSAPLTCF